MLIKNSSLKNIKTSPGIIQAEALSDGGLLSNNEIIIIADGVQTYIDYIKKTFPNTGRDSDSERRGGEGEFQTFPSYNYALDIFQNKPSSLVVYDPLELNPVSYEESGNDVDYDVTGDFIDMGRFMEGVPESIGSMHNGKVRDRRVRILIDNVHVASTDARDMQHRSERIIRLIDSLERAKTRTEVLVINSGECSHEEITVKKFDESLVIEDVAVVTHPDFFRRLQFRVIEHSKTFRFGYGNPYHTQENFDKLRSTLNDEITIYLEGSPSGKDSTNRAFDELETMLEEELSLPQPANNLFIVHNRSTEAKGFN